MATNEPFPSGVWEGGGEACMRVFLKWSIRHFTRDIPVERLYTSPQIEDALGRLVYVRRPPDVLPW